MMPKLVKGLTALVPKLTTPTLSMHESHNQFLNTLLLVVFCMRMHLRYLAVLGLGVDFALSASPDGFSTRFRFPKHEALSLIAVWNRNARSISISNPKTGV